MMGKNIVRLNERVTASGGLFFTHFTRVRFICIPMHKQGHHIFTHRFIEYSSEIFEYVLHDDYALRYGTLPSKTTTAYNFHTTIKC